MTTPKPIPTSTPVPHPHDDGSATIWTVGAIALLLIVLLFVLTAATVVTTRHRAESAADLAALAAARQAAAGTQSACAQANQLAARTDVTVTACRIQGWDAYVEVDARLPADLQRFGAVHARARAGPDTTAPDPPTPDPGQP